MMGFCSSYDKVKKYERSAATTHGMDIPGFTSSHFVQYAADNVDHNIVTLDGLNTFHGMGMIAAITPGTKQCKPVRKIKTSSDDIAAVGRVNIHFHKSQSSGMPQIEYEGVPFIDLEDSTSNLDTLWKLSLLFKSPRPNWSGMMQAVHQGHHPGKSSVIFLPMIDMNPVLHLLNNALYLYTGS